MDKPMIIIPENSKLKTWVVKTFGETEVNLEVQAAECQTNGGCLFFRDEKGLLVRALAMGVWDECVLK